MHARSKSSHAENFSFTRGGALHWLLVRLSHGEDVPPLLVRKTLLAVLITWLPPFVLSLVQGQTLGQGIKIPFLRDFAVNLLF
jgi:hypothetical protein